MKKLLYIATVAALALAGLSGCTPSNKPSTSNAVVGQWELVDYATKSVTISGATVSVYVDFKADKSFVIYQMIGQGRYRIHDGTYTFSNGVLSGKYSKNSQPLGATYKVSIEGDNMILEDIEKNSSKQTFSKVTIPSQVISSAFKE